MRKSVCAKMIFCLLHFLPLFVTFPGLHGLRVNPYGLYEDIVVEISNQVPRQKCQRALDNLEVSHFFSINVLCVDHVILTGCRILKLVSNDEMIITFEKKDDLCFKLFTLSFLLYITYV